MPFQLGATVRTSDGHDAGTIERLISDPATNVVTGCVLSTGGLLGRQIYIAAHELGELTADGDAVRLSASQAELDERPAYEEASAAKP